VKTEEFLSRLKGVRRSRNGWIALCPAHEDRNPSLSLRENHGKTLLHCFGGCTPDAVCASLDLSLADLFSEPGVPRPKPRAAREAEKHTQNLRIRLTPRERVLPITVVYSDLESLEAGIARALALAVEGEIVQAVLQGDR